MCTTLFTLRGVESGDLVCKSPDGTPFLVFGNVLPPDAFCERRAVRRAVRPVRTSAKEMRRDV